MFVFITTPLFLFAQGDSPPLDINSYFTSFIAFASVIPIVFELIKKILPQAIPGIVVQILSWILGIALALGAFFLDLGIFADIKLALYALITIYVTGKVIDSLTIGLNYKKGALIISDKYKEIAEKIKTSLNRGGTYFNGSGLQSDTEKKIIFTAVNRRELVALQYYVKEIDPKAFVTILDVRGVRGEGFKSFEDDL